MTLDINAEAFDFCKVEWEASKSFSGKSCSLVQLKGYSVQLYAARFWREGISKKTGATVGTATKSG
jgi:hypothetical protein